MIDKCATHSHTQCTISCLKHFIKDPPQPTPLDDEAHMQQIKGWLLLNGEQKLDHYVMDPSSSPPLDAPLSGHK
jgi:hypothetical protein